MIINVHIYNTIPLTNSLEQVAGGTKEQVIM